MELNAASDIYIGGTPVSAVYLGSTKVWERVGTQAEAEEEGGDDGDE